MNLKTPFKEIGVISTGKYDVNHSSENGRYPFFTCAMGQFRSDTFSFDDEAIILPGNGANVGQVFYYSGPFEAYQRTYVLHKIKADVKYVYHFFKGFWAKSLIGQQFGSATNYIRYNNIAEFAIPIPPLETQKKIAAILDKADELRQNDKKILEKYDQLAQSVFLEMFGDPVINEKGWEITKFFHMVSDDCPLTYGIVQPGDEFNDGTIIVRPVDLEGKFVSVDGLKRIDPEISDKYKRTILKGNELLLSVRGSVGSISYATQDLIGANVTRGIVPIWANSSVANKDFIYGLFSNHRFKKKLQGLSKGATLIQLNLFDLRDLDVVCPPLVKQNKFSSVIKCIDSQRQFTQQSLQKCEELFQSLLQRAFRGELV